MACCHRPRTQVRGGRSLTYIVCASAPREGDLVGGAEKEIGFSAVRRSRPMHPLGNGVLGVPRRIGPSLRTRGMLGLGFKLYGVVSGSVGLNHPGNLTEVPWVRAGGSLVRPGHGAVRQVARCVAVWRSVARHGFFENEAEAAANVNFTKRTQLKKVANSLLITHCVIFKG